MSASKIISKHYPIPPIMRKTVTKCVVIGDSFVGKTSLLEQFISRKFSGNYRATIGTDFLTKEVMVKDQLVIIQLWDTAGQDRFSTLGSAFYRGTEVCAIVFDVTRQKTFDNVQKWYEEFIATPGVAEDCPVILIGNKSDLEHERVVPQARALRWCQGKKHSVYIETSAKEFMNVEQAFNKAAEIALDARDDGIYRVQTDLDKVDLEKLKHPNPDDRPGNCAC